MRSTPQKTIESAPQVVIGQDAKANMVEACQEDPGNFDGGV